MMYRQMATMYTARIGVVILSLMLLSCGRVAEWRGPVGLRASVSAEQTVLPGDLVTLTADDGFGGRNSSIRVTWTASTQNAEGVILNNENSLQASFPAPSTMGTYIFHFQATNGDFWANASTKIHVQPIIVSAGSLQNVLPGDPVTLTGSYNTNDVTRRDLPIEWVAATGNPATVTLSGATTLSPTFVAPGVVGEYVFNLSVQNGTFVGQSRVTVNVVELVVNAGVNQTVLSGDTVRLTGTYDTAGVAAPSLSIEWVAAPNNPANVTLSGATTLSPTFVAPNTPGTYTFDLKVTNNGIIRTAKTNVQVRTLTWTQATASAPWSGRDRHTTAVFNNKLWVIGGNLKNDVWCSSDGVNWIQATASAPWSGRGGHTTAVFNNKLWVIGGSDGRRKNDVWFMELTQE